MRHASRPARALRVTIACLTNVGAVAIASPAAAQEPCFERLDNGVDTTGWQRSATNHHGPGLGWTVEGGAMVGRQTAGQLGGILMTNKTYRDVEVLFEVKIDWGCDSGLFFRTTAGDRAYQVNVDHLTGGGIGTIYGESFTTLLRARDYTLTNQGNTAVVEPGHTPIFDLGTWSTIWHPTEFNEIRARIEGNPPHIQAWISNVKVMDFTDDQLRSEMNPAGPLAIQVHMGPDRWIAGGTVRFRNIRAKDLTIVCTGSMDAGDERAPANEPDARTNGDARPMADVQPVPGMDANADAASPPNGERDAEPIPGPAPVDAAKDPPAGSDSGLGLASPGQGSDGSSGCACTSSRSSADVSAAALLLIALAGSIRRGRTRVRSSTKFRDF
jgi:MYXO-CTERM domain-containing protein